MNQRCNNPNARNYKWYGGKGIKVEWPSFQDFYEWAVHSGYVPGLELDRIDPNKNYCSNNCMWSTKGDNITRAHLDIDKSVLQQATILAKDRECTLSKVIEEALVLFLNGTKEV